ncbi:MAG TPA: NAD(P)/FAD-dependent oxidoreductase [Chloroflexota bacterium]|nr:NAD(P)/FAD-dependent oxidoreductase [Chloroflexota bacterium]
MTDGSRYGPWLAVGAAGLAAYALLRAKRSRGQSLVGQPQTGPRIVVLGAGFAGLAAARRLAARAPDARILVIDQHNYHLFTPPLFQVASCATNPYDIAFPLRAFAAPRAITFRQGMVAGIDFDNRRVQVAEETIPYDYLVVALGSTTNFFGNQSAQEHALPLKSLEDAVALRHHIIGVLERANRATDPDERRAFLTFALVGGGSTGVETASAFSDLLHRLVPAEYPGLDPRDVRVLVIESRGKLLGHMSDRLAAIALAKLQAMGVEAWLNTQAKDVQADCLATEDGRTVRAETIIWTAGVRAPEVIAHLNAPHGHAGSLAIDAYLRVQGHPEVYAVGDNAAVEDARTHHPVPLLAQAAIQEGEAAAENLIRALRGEPALPFHYRPLGNAVSLGRTEGAVEVAGIVVDGIAGGLGWKLIHLARMTDLRNQLGTALGWGLNLVQAPDTTRLDLATIKSGIGSQPARRRSDRASREPL